VVADFFVPEAVTLLVAPAFAISLLKLSDCSNYTLKNGKALVFHGFVMAMIPMSRFLK
jgi:hypothetical protein